MTVVFAPGQGAQKSGMLTPWCASQEALSLLSQWSDAIDMDLRYLGTEASIEEITDTAIAQPLLVAGGILSFYALSAVVKFPQNTILAGHSVGELTIAAISGVISYHEAIHLAAKRGALMANACRETPSGMAAILGGTKETVLEHLQQHNLVPANFNAEGQIVAGGSADDIAALLSDPPTGSRVRNLAVAGAFHSHFMDSAYLEFARIASTLSTSDPQYIVLSNRDGHVVNSGKDFLDKIVYQITAPVLWTSCLEYVRTNDIPGPIIELTPASTLLGIAKRELKNLSRIAINSPADIDNNDAELQEI